jgi:microsomal dipeptidase-like Zn-dependent dipeptidase
MRIVLLIVIVLGAALGIGLAVIPGIVEGGMNRVVAHEPWPVGERAADLHASLRVADWHADSLLWDRDLLRRADRGHVDVPRLEAGNVTLQVFTAVTKSPAGQNYESNTADSDNITALAVVQQWPPRTWTSLAERALHQAQRLHAFAERAPERLVVVRDRAGLAAGLAERAEGDGPVLAVLGIEGMHALDGDLANLDRLWDAGYRVFGLTHFFDNALGGSLHGTSGAGLTAFGREVVAAVHQRGGIVDLAHASPAMVEDVLATSEGPVIVSHTGLAGVCDTPRNLSDALMARIVERGGLIGIGYWDAAVCDITPAGVAASIAYGVERLGPGAVSLGSDYDGATEVAFDTSELPALTHALLEAGLEEETIRAVMGENTLAFLRRHLP